MKWKEFSLNRKDGHPEPGQLCVVRRVVPRTQRHEYLVGRFERDLLNPNSPNFWWWDGRGTVTENAANWPRRYCGVVWAALCPPEPQCEEVRD